MQKDFTILEIKTQVDSWKTVWNDIKSLDQKYLKKNYDKIILFGCGSSYNIAISAAFFTNYYSDIDAVAVPSSELSLNYNAYIKDGVKYLLIGFSRSGETSETINVITKTKTYKNIKSMVFTCRKENSLIKVSDQFFLCREAEEKSVVMTKSFSSMLLAYVIFLLKECQMSDNIREFQKLFNYMESKMDIIFEIFKNLLDEIDINSFFALGSGFNYGLAVEADLKMKEMSQIPSYSYHVYEFNHGPKSLLEKESLCLFLSPDHETVKNIKIIISEILKVKAKILIIGEKINYDGVIPILEDADFSDPIKSFVNIPVFQILAYLQTVKKGLNPDRPRNLSYTTKI